MESSAANPRVCFFGNYDPNYIRTMVVLRGLRDNNCKVLECNDVRPGLAGYRSLYRQHKEIKGTYDILIVGNSGKSRMYVLLAKLFTSQPIIWDAHFSLYDAWVYDRKVFSRWSLKALYHWTLEWLATCLATQVYLDTKAHKEYFIKLFNANPKKFFHIYVGADDTMFNPDKYEHQPNPDTFIVEFHGKYIPLQGVQYIIEAAKKLEKQKDIKFKLIGNGQTYEESRTLAADLQVSNIEFIPKVPYEHIPKLIMEADVCLGIFGDTPKTQRVIPNKLYEAVAMGKPVITARTEAITEVFSDKENIILCNTADADDLATQILTLYKDRSLCELIGQKTRALYESQLVPKVISAELLKNIGQISHK